MVQTMRWMAAAAVLGLAACGGLDDGEPPQAGPADLPRAAADAATEAATEAATDAAAEEEPTVTADPAPAEPPDEPGQTVVPYRAEVRTTDAATADFPEVLHAILTDARGWVRAGFEFVPDAGAQYLIVLAEGPEVDALCHPYDTRGLYSCQNGPVVALNADRWREATPQWPADLDSYRIMLVNHEVGHLLHLHHPDPQCPGPGLPAPVMAQQSTALGDCLPNPWPLQWEVDLAAQRLEPLAPPADHDPSDHRPVPPPTRH